jgi:hypothetical protein
MAPSVPIGLTLRRDGAPIDLVFECERRRAVAGRSNCARAGGVGAPDVSARLIRCADSLGTTG